LLVYGSEDPDVPIAEAQRMAAAACRPDELVVVNVTSHGGYLDSPDAQMYAARLLGFFDSHLLGATVG
jgi:pimeloyl-ACP methyl ester carboxylesterase